KGGANELTVNSLSGGISNGRDGWAFNSLTVETPRSRFILDGQVDRRVSPTVLDLDVNAERFAFQEWAGVLSGLKNIAVEGRFHTTLKGPLAGLDTTLDLDGSGGGVRGSLVLDTTVPGWRGVGGLDIRRLDLARWLNRPDRPSDITGRVDFNLDLRLGRMPTGRYTFDGSHAGFMTYEADDLKARGDLTLTEVRIAEATATAYGSNVTINSGAIGLSTPYPFTFLGRARGVDLRQVPPTVPVPHVESELSFAYDVTGRFVEPFITGRAQFDTSEFLGAALGAGATGSIDTFVRPFHYDGEGEITNVDLHRFGADLGVQWLQEPRYAGTVSGRFHVDGSGSDLATMTLTGGGRIHQADLFGGGLIDADVSIELAAGTLRGTYDGRLHRMNPRLALDDPRFEASLTGRGRARIEVRELLLRSPLLADYVIEGELALTSSTVRTVTIDTGDLSATLTDGTLDVKRMTVNGPAVELESIGTVEFDGTRSSRLSYVVRRADLSMVRDLLGRDVGGELATTGELTGTTARLRVAGNGTLTRLDAMGVKALATTAEYDATVPTDAPRDSTATLSGRASFVEGFRQQIQQIDGTVEYDRGRASLDLEVAQREGLTAHVTAMLMLHPEDRQVDVTALTMAFRRGVWQLASSAGAHLSWTDGSVTVRALTFTDANAGQTISVDGTWSAIGGGALEVTGRGIFLDTFAPEGQQPVRYGGMADFDATLSGTRQLPIVTGEIMITDGRIRRLSYQKLAGQVELTDGILALDLRLDQAPGVWLTAIGTLPLGVFDTTLPDRPMNVALRSSEVGLGLIEGVTDVVRDVSGQLRVDVRAVGSSRDPHFDGTVDITEAAFLVAASGARYKNGRAAMGISPDRITVESLHIEDRDGNPLDVKGSLGTHELRVGDLEIDATGKEFEVLRNELGRIDVDVQLQLRGQFESPRVTGRVTVSGGGLAVDTILDRALFQPYSTEPAAIPAAGDIDAIAALNPWDRLGLGIELHVPNTLRMIGDNVQVTSGTPLGFGNINLRVFGDLYLYKDPAQPLYVNGSLDQVTGTYTFQGRRFDLDPVSSINFNGDLNPDLFVTVTRVISGVETRVTIAGPLSQPELRLASIPPLEASDILSLIVFNTSTNDLSALQQEQLAVRAGTLAAGFLAAPLMTALERTLGLSTLEIEPGADSRGGNTRVTIGDELAPGLVARFSRQFGQDEYDEATIEYYLSNILRIRATFSDASELVRSPFRRVERAGIDLLIFFSF
ncbi:MAG: hypothetical protein GEU82_08840, partial [Luteitalea sp.]|nr:hypothetical protein [Luteitalea sp.]